MDQPTAANIYIWAAHFQHNPAIVDVAVLRLREIFAYLLGRNGYTNKIL